MKTLYFRRPNKLALLHDELLAAIPSLSPVPVIRVEGLGEEVWLTVPDDADEAAISTVVQDHDSTRVQSSVIAES